MTKLNFKGIELHTSSKKILTQNTPEKIHIKKPQKNNKIRVQLYLNEEDVDFLNQEWKKSGISSFSSFLVHRMKQKNVI